LTPARAVYLYDIEKKLCESFYPGKVVSKGMPALREALKEALSVGSGDDEIEGGNAAEAFRRAFFIPAWALSPIFGKSWDKLRKLEKKGKRFIWKLNEHFCRKAYLLGLVINRLRRIDDESLIKCERGDNGKGHYVCSAPREAMRKFNWKYDFGEDQVFFFIPLRFLP
jgi:hypothetical protein